jgi:ubiquinone/menaquinone biosynthesis C-methylase UbiE
MQNIYDDPRFFEGYRRMREGSFTMNELVEQPALRACLPALEGLDVLELGCGMGHMSVLLAEKGASVLATDASERMLSVARRDRAHERIKYLRCAMEDLEFADRVFDLVVGSLCVHYVEDYPTLVRKVARWLKSGGRFVYSLEHPTATAPKDPESDWVEDGEGNRLFWPVYGYGDEGPREQTWYVEGVVKHHRKVSTLVNGLVAAGLTIERLEELPEVVPPGNRPVFPENRQRPSVLILSSTKAVAEGT